VFKIETVLLSLPDMANNRWVCKRKHYKGVRGKTIREAEITLLQAIFEQENKNG